MSEDPEIIRTSLRLPKPLYDKISQSAESRGVTMHAEILSLLNFAVSFDVENAYPEELANQLNEKLSVQESLLKETRDELMLIKEWIKMGAPDLRKS